MLTINKLNTCKKKLSSSITDIDNFFRKPIIKKICFGFVIVVSFCLIYLLNVLHPLFGDDWAYSMQPYSDVKIATLGDILRMQYKHYFLWGGRSVVHVIAQSLLLAGTSAGDFINSLAYIIFTLVIYYISNQSNKLRPSLLLAINFLIWFFQPAFGSTILWITGSANYLWGSLIIILFLIPYIKFAHNPQKENSILKAIVLFACGVIAGWTNENMSVALIFILLLLLFFYKKNTVKIPVWVISGSIGVALGCIILIAAPGNYLRMGQIISDSGSHASFFTIYANRFIEAVKAYYFYAFGITFIYGLILIVYQTYGKINKKSHILFLSLSFFSAAIIATLAMSAAPIFPGRAAFGIITFIIVAIGILLANLDYSKSIISNVSYITLFFALLLFIPEYKGAYQTLKAVDSQLEVRLNSVKSQKKAGKKDVIIEGRINAQSRFLHYFELAADSTNWHNQMFSNYYNIHSIIVK